MSTIREQLEAELDRLQELRDELRLQAHLARGDLKEEWERAEGRFLELSNKLKLVQSASEESLQEVASSLRQLVGEIREGYRHIKAILA